MHALVSVYMNLYSGCAHYCPWVLGFQRSHKTPKAPGGGWASGGNARPLLSCHMQERTGKHVCIVTVRRRERRKESKRGSE